VVGPFFDCAAHCVAFSLTFSSFGSEFLPILCYFLGKQSDYNLTLIKPLAGFPASKPIEIVAEAGSGGELI